MNILEATRLAVESIWANRLRSFLTLLGVIIGIAAIVATARLQLNIYPVWPAELRVAAGYECDVLGPTMSQILRLYKEALPARGACCCAGCRVVRRLPSELCPPPSVGVCTCRCWRGLSGRAAGLRAR